MLYCLCISLNLHFDVKPGLTGYWQAYARNNATYESGERQRMEIEGFSIDQPVVDKDICWTMDGNDFVKSDA